MWTDTNFPGDLPEGWVFVLGSGSTTQTANQHVRAVYRNPDDEQHNLESYRLKTGTNLATNGGFTVYSGSPVDFSDWVESASGSSTISQTAAYGTYNYCVFNVDVSNNEVSILQTVSGASSTSFFIFKFVASVDNAGGVGTHPTLVLENPTNRGGANSTVAIELDTTSVSQYIAGAFARSGGSFKLKTSLNCSNRVIKITDIEIYECSPVGLYLQDNTDRVFLRTVAGVLDVGDYYHISWDVLPRYTADSGSQEYQFSTVDFTAPRDVSGTLIDQSSLLTPGHKEAVFKAIAGPIGTNGKVKFAISDVSETTAGHSSLGNIKIKKALAPASTYDPLTQNPNNIRDTYRGLQKLGETVIPHSGSAPPLVWAQDAKVFDSPTYGVGTSSEFRLFIGKHTPGGSLRYESFPFDISDVSPGNAAGDGKFKGHISEVAVLPQDYSTLIDSAEYVIRPNRRAWEPRYNAAIGGGFLNILENGEFEAIDLVTSSLDINDKRWVANDLNYVTISDYDYIDTTRPQDFSSQAAVLSYQSPTAGKISQRFKMMAKTPYLISAYVKPNENVNYEFLLGYPVLSCSLQAANILGSSYYWGFEDYSWGTTFTYSKSTYNNSWRRFDRAFVNTFDENYYVQLTMEISSAYQFEGATSLMLDRVVVTPLEDVPSIVRNGDFTGIYQKPDRISNEGLDSATSWSSTVIAPSAISFAAGLESNCAVFDIASTTHSLVTLSQASAMDFMDNYLLSFWSKLDTDGGYSSYSMLIDAAHPATGVTVSHLVGPLSQTWKHFKTIIRGNPFGPENLSGTRTDTGRLVFRSGINLNGKDVFIDELMFAKIGTYFKTDPWSVDGQAAVRAIGQPDNKVLNGQFDSSSQYWVTSALSGGIAEIIESIGHDPNKEYNYLFHGVVDDAVATNYKFQIAQSGGMDPYHTYSAFIYAKASAVADPLNPPSLDIVGLTSPGVFTTQSNYFTLSDEWKEYKVDFIGYHPGPSVFSGTDVGQFILRGGQNLVDGLEVFVDNIRIYEKQMYEYFRLAPPIRGHASAALPTSSFGEMREVIGKYKFEPGEKYRLSFAAYCTASTYPDLPLYVMVHNSTKNMSYLENSSYIGYGGSIKPGSIFGQNATSEPYTDVKWQTGQRYSRVLITPATTELESDSAEWQPENVPIGKRYELEFEVPSKFHFSDSYTIAFCGHISQSAQIFTNPTLGNAASGWTYAALGGASVAYDSGKGVIGTGLFIANAGASDDIAYIQQTALAGTADSLGTKLYRIEVDASATDASGGTVVATENPNIAVRAGTSLGNTALANLNSSTVLGYNYFKRIIFENVPNSVDGTVAIRTPTNGSGTNVKLNVSRIYGYEQTQIITTSVGEFTSPTGWAFTQSGESSIGIQATGGIAGTPGVVGVFDGASSWVQLGISLSTYSYTSSMWYLTKFHAMVDTSDELRLGVYAAADLSSGSETVYYTNTLSNTWQEYLILHPGQVGVNGWKMRTFGTASEDTVRLDNVRVFKYPCTISDNYVSTWIHLDAIDINKL